MKQSAEASGFPVVGACVSASLVALVVAPLAYFGFAGLFGMPVGPAVITGGVLGWTTAMLTFAIIGFVAPMGLMPTVYGWFGAMFLRMAICMAGAWIAKLQYQVSGKPLAASLAAFYLPLLLVELAWVGRFLWRKRADVTTTAPVAKSM
jgi:hypothetical protein